VTAQPAALAPSFASTPLRATVPSDQQVEVPGGRVFIRRWPTEGSARAPLVLLHDSLGSVEQWRDFPEALAQATGREVLAYDRLGFGQSTPRTTRPGVDFIREESSALFPAMVRALGLTRYALFGHSVGGAMALSIAAEHGAACEAVVTEAAQAFVEGRTLAGIRAARAQFDDPEQFEKLTRWHGAKAKWVLNAWTEVWLSDEFAAWSLDDVLGRVQCPALAIHGDLDEFGSVEFPRRITSRSGGRSELAILANCGHVPHRERRDEVLRVTTSFLEQANPQAHH
jgi:pimeloyl-ACP methyl ester carboxylesterase